MQSTPTKALVIASYAGERRNGGSGAEFLDTWYEVLTTYKHSLNAIIVAVNRVEDEPVAYRDSVVNLKSLDTSGIFYRHNISGSYGAWWDVGRHYGKLFDWYFLFEDDYVVNQDNWDDKILEFKAPKVGYIGQSIQDNGFGWHLAASCGAISSEMFDRCIFGEYGSHIYDPSLQVGWSNMIQEAGYKIVDIGTKYSVPYDNGKAIQYFGLKDGPTIIVPYRYYRGVR